MAEAIRFKIVHVFLEENKSLSMMEGVLVGTEMDSDLGDQRPIPYSFTFLLCDGFTDS